VTRPDWASRLAAAIELRLAARAGEVQLHSVTATSSEEVEVVYEVVYCDLADSGLRGFRISADVVRSAPERIRESSIDELAFDIVTTGICEPRPPEDFLSPDVNGVRWLSTSRWLEEVS
jgi:hypothetical protein